MYDLEQLNAELYTLRATIQRKADIQQAIITRLAQIEIELKRLDEPPAFDRFSHGIAILHTRMKTVEDEVTDLQGQDCQMKNDLYNLTARVDGIAAR